MIPGSQTVRIMFSMHTSCPGYKICPSRYVVSDGELLAISGEGAVFHSSKKG